MNWMPLVGFLWKHGSQIEAMVPKGASSQPSLLLDAATALAPVVKKHWPQLNAENLVDDGLAALKESIAPTA